MLTGDGDGRRGSTQHLQLHGHRSGSGHAHDHDRLRRQRRQGRRVRHLQRRHRAGQLPVLLRRRAGDDQRDRHGHRLRRRHRHRQPGRRRDGQQRRPDGDLVGRQRPDGQRGHASTPTASPPPTRARTTSRSLSTDCGANGSQVGTTTFNTTTGCGSFVCSFPDGPATRARLGPGRGLRRRRQQHRHPDRDDRQRRPDGDLDSGNDLSVNEGTTHTYSFTISDPGADTFVLDATDCGANGTQVGADTFNTTTGAGSFVLLVPRRPAASTSCRCTVSDSDGAPTATPPPRP